MEQRPVVRKAIVEVVPDWKKRLGPDHIVDLDLIGQIAAKNIPSPPNHARRAGEGFAAGSRYIPGRNLIMLSMCASVAFRRDIRALDLRSERNGIFRGYPDCRRRIHEGGRNCDQLVELVSYSRWNAR